MSCLIVVSLVFAADESDQFRGPDISGQWQVEGELLRESGHRVLFAYGELREEDYDEARAIHFGDAEGEYSSPIVQSGSTIEGTGVRKVPCGEQPKVTYEGSVSSDNQVELTVTIPGIRQDCDVNDKPPHLRDAACTFVQTD
jgi:hypothetical protein